MTTKTEKIQKLWTLYESVQNTLDEYQDKLDDLRKARAVAISDALEFSERIAPSAFAPVGWTEGLPLLNAFPPAPQADQMRLGRLSEYNRRVDQGISTASSSSSQTKNLHESIAMKTAMEKVKSLKERLKAKKEEDLRKEEEMEVESLPRIVEEVSRQREEAVVAETVEQAAPSFEYLSTSTRRTSLTFTPAEESESDEEEED